MATSGDFNFLLRAIAGGVVQGPLLEIGSRSWQGTQGNTAHIAAEAGFDWTGADFDAGPGVDLELDILDTEAVSRIDKRWKSVLLFNLLEHVYDPIGALRNALALVAEGGSFVIVSPAVWQLHDYPRDYWRPLPDFYFEFAARHGCEIVPGFAGSSESARFR